MTYDPRRAICLVPGEEIPDVGYRTTRDKELERKEYLDAMQKRWEKKHPPVSKREQRKIDERADAKWERRHETRKNGWI